MKMLAECRQRKHANDKSRVVGYHFNLLDEDGRARRATRRCLLHSTARSSFRKAVDHYDQATVTSWAANTAARRYQRVCRRRGRILRVKRDEHYAYGQAF